MTDSTDGTEPELTPEQEAEVRRLLADARHNEPAPDAVVARLDRVLADLASEPAREATVTRLADRRRRAGLMLVAAAAVVVAGVGISNVVDGSGSADSESAAGTAADVPEAAEAPDEGGGDPLAESDSATGAQSRRETPYRITAKDFSTDASALRGVASALADEAQEYAAQADDLDQAPARDVCEAGDWGPGGYVSVLYEQAPGWVVIRPEQGDTQVADLFLCGSEVATRSVTLPVR